MNTEVIVSGISALAALVACYFSARSSLAARRSARAASQQAKINHISAVQEWEPPVIITLADARFCWSDRIPVPLEQRAKWGGELVGEPLTAEGANKAEKFVQITVNVDVENTTNHQVMLTLFRNCKDRISYPNRHDGVFWSPQGFVSQAILEPQQKIRLVWVENRNFDFWRQLYVATRHSDIATDPDLRAPSFRLADRFKAFRKYGLDGLKSQEWHWGQDLIGETGFSIVGESRFAARVPCIWNSFITASPVTPAGRDEDSGKLLWHITQPPSGLIDDDIIRYRCRPDYSLAQFDPPRLIRVPGRS